VYHVTENTSNMFHERIILFLTTIYKLVINMIFCWSVFLMYHKKFISLS